MRSLISRSGQDTNAVAGSIEPADEKLKGVYISREVVTDHESRDAASDTMLCMQRNGRHARVPFTCDLCHTHVNVFMSFAIYCTYFFFFKRLLCMTIEV